MSTLYAVTIDTEEGWNWSAGWPVTQHSLDNIDVAPRFHELCSRHGAKTTWFVNWSVLNDSHSREIVLAIGREAETELGLHIHPWLTPPHPPGLAYGERESFLATYPADLALAKLRSVLDLFEGEGVATTSFRGGRYSTSPGIQTFLAERGFLADASVVPFTAWPDDGSPDYRERSLQPRRVATGKGPIWEVPLTVGFTRRPFALWARRLDLFSQSPFSTLHLVGILSRLGVVSRAWLNFEDTPSELMLRLLEVLRPMKLPCITLTVHSSSLALGGNPYSATRHDVDRIWSRVVPVLERLRQWPEFEPATVTEIAQRLEARHEDHRN